MSITRWHVQQAELEAAMRSAEPKVNAKVRRWMQVGTCGAVATGTPSRARGYILSIPARQMLDIDGPSTVFCSPMANTACGCNCCYRLVYTTCTT